jgi:hypothetical protein
MGEYLLVNLDKKEYFNLNNTIETNELELIDKNKNMSQLLTFLLTKTVKYFKAGKWFGDRIGIVVDYDKNFEDLYNDVINNYKEMRLREFINMRI